MQLQVILKNIGNNIKSVAGNGILLAKKHSPELLIGGGVAGFVLTIVETVKATNKTNDILERRESLLDTAHRYEDSHPDDVPPLDEKTIKRMARHELIKTWFPVVTTGGGSIFMVLKGVNILNGRYVATAAALRASDALLERYRGNVISEFGEEVDWRMLNNVKPEDAEKERKQREKIADEKAEARDAKRRPRTKYYEVTSQVFDKYSERWRTSWTPRQVWNYLIDIENEMNDKLAINKHLFLNEVYDRLGLPRTSEGQVVGWIITPNNKHDTLDTRVSFGLREMPAEAREDFMRETYNENIWIRLHFNPDGLIYNMIDKDLRRDNY